MITYEDALLKANGYLNEMDLNVCLLTEHTIEFEYGWVFFYQSAEYLRTGDYSEILLGNAPFIINKYDGSLYVTGTAYSEEVYIEEYIQMMKQQ